MKGLLSMAGVALVSYVVGRHVAEVTGSALVERPDRLADVERRLAALEEASGASRADSADTEATPLRQPRKEYTAFHYEALANLAAHERRMTELDWRLSEMELRRHASRAVRCAGRQTATTGDRRHG